MSNNGTPVDFPGNNPTFKFKQKLTGLTGNDGTKAVQIMVPLEYLINFWRTLEMLLTNCETNFTQNWAANSVISNAVHNQAIILAITDTKLYVPVVTLLTQDNGKLLQQLKLGYNYTINRNIKSRTTKCSKLIFRFLNFPKFSRSKYTFCFTIYQDTGYIIF